MPKEAGLPALSRAMMIACFQMEGMSDEARGQVKERAEVGNAFGDPGV